AGPSYRAPGGITRGVRAWRGTRSGPSCTARCWARETTAAWGAPEAGRTAPPARPEADEVLMMEPPPAAIMWGMAYLLPSRKEVTLMLRVAFQISRGMSTTVVSWDWIAREVMATVLWSTLRVPKVSTALSISALMESASAAS